MGAKEKIGVQRITWIRFPSDRLIERDKKNSNENPHRDEKNRITQRKGSGVRILYVQPELLECEVQ